MKSKVTIIFYGDYGFSYGKGPRYTYLAESLQESGHPVEIICRKSSAPKSGRCINIKSCGLSGYFIQAFGRLCQGFLDKNEIRNLQESMFDRIVARKLRQLNLGTHAITVSGLPCVMRQLRSQRGSTVLSIVNTVPFPGFLENPSRIYRHVKNESERHLKSLAICDLAIFPSYAAAKAFFAFIPPHRCLALADWLLNFSSVVSFQRREPFEPKIGYCGGQSEIKGGRLVENWATAFKKPVTMFDYSPRTNFGNNFLDCRQHSPISSVRKFIDILLVPSYADAEPRVIREFVSEGKVVVARNSLSSIKAPNLLLFETDTNFHQVICEAVTKCKNFTFSRLTNNVENSYNKNLADVVLQSISGKKII